MALVKRLVKGSPLTFAEGDANLDYLESLSTALNAWTGSNTSQFAGTASFVALTGLGIDINGLSITASVRTVNGSSPINGNIAVSLAATYTGFSSSLSGTPSLQASSSGPITASFSGGALWIVTGETDPARTGSNGETYIFASGSVGQWIQVPNYSQNAADARYLKLSGGTMTGNIDMGNKDATNAGTWQGTAYTASYVSPTSVSSSIASYNGFGTLTQTLTSNISLGGNTSGTSYNTGTNIEEILRTLLIQYQPPTISGLTLKATSVTVPSDGNPRDVGRSFSFNTASFTSTADSPNGRFAYSASFTASGADVGTISYYFGDNVLGSSNNLSVGNIYSINRATTSGTVTFRVRAQRPDTLANITDTTTTVNFYWRNYLCASSTIITDNATAQTVINTGIVESALDTNKAWAPVCTSANDTLGNYTYIIYPASYGDLSSITQDGSLPVLLSFTELGDYTITNAYGSSISMRVYKSNSDKAFASGVVLTIT
jgi:hypothetical protein